jgi:phosphoglycerate-specific signal transduction histidine kinase
MMRVTTMGQLTASIAHEVNQPLSGMGIGLSVSRSIIRKAWRSSVGDAVPVMRRPARTG